jgi:UDP-glucuronate 4-epimerase
MKILVTGAAGFIGYHTVNKFINEGYEVVGLDNINDYYSPQLKYERLSNLGIDQDSIKWFETTTSTLYSNLKFVRIDISDKFQLLNLFKEYSFDIVINLAAQAGVRYSIENPDVYMNSNVIGFYNILEACRKYPVTKLVHASSSSIYGDNSKIPFSEEDKTDSPVSLYAATKKSNELMGHSYNHLYKIPITCLRFFTVYGPWGRPDMAPMLFAKAILNNKPINIFNNGEMERDFTYVDDIVNGIFYTAFNIEKGFKVLNIGNGSPVNLMKFINILEEELGKVSKKNFMPMQAGDVKLTYSDTTKLKEECSYNPETTLKAGVNKFVSWVNKYPQLIK